MYGFGATDNGGYITIHEDTYPESGPGPSKVPGQGTWGLGQEMILPDGEHFIVSDPGPVPQSEMDQVQGLGAPRGSRAWHRARAHARGIFRGLWAVIAPNGTTVAVVRGRARAVASGYQLRRIKSGSIPQELMRAKSMLKKHYTKGFDPGPLSARQQAFLKRKGWWNYMSQGRTMPIPSGARRMPPSGPGPATVPSAGTWGLGRSVEADVIAAREGYGRPYFPVNTPGIPEELGASLYFENEAGYGANIQADGLGASLYFEDPAGYGANIQADGLGATLYFEDEGEGPGDYMDVPGGTQKLNNVF